MALARSAAADLATLATARALLTSVAMNASALALLPMLLATAASASDLRDARSMARLLMSQPERASLNRLVKRRNGTVGRNLTAERLGPGLIAVETLRSKGRRYTTTRRVFDVGGTEPRLVTTESPA